MEGHGASALFDRMGLAMLLAWSAVRSLDASILADGGLGLLLGWCRRYCFRVEKRWACAKIDIGKPGSDDAL